MKYSTLNLVAKKVYAQSYFTGLVLAEEGSGGFVRECVDWSLFFFIFGNN